MTTSCVTNSHPNLYFAAADAPPDVSTVYEPRVYGPVAPAYGPVARVYGPSAPVYGPFAPAYRPVAVPLWPTTPVRRAPAYSDAQAAADAKVLWQATEGGLFGWGTDEDAIWSVLSGKSAADIATLSSAFRDNYGRDLNRVLDDELGDGDMNRARELMLGNSQPIVGNPEDAVPPGGWTPIESAMRLHDAVDGLGTDEAAVRATLEGVTKEEIGAIARAYRERYGEDLRSQLDDDLDGRDQFELLNLLYDHGTLDFQSNPRGAIEQQIWRERAMQKYEGMGSLDLGFAQKLFHGDFSFESDGERLQRTLNTAEQYLQAGDLANAARYAGFSQQNVRTLIETKDQAAELAATGAAIVAATTVTLATAGTASPLMVVALSAAASGTAGGVAYGAVNPQAGGTEILRQVGIATATGATGAVPIGRGATLAASLTDDAAGLAARTGLRTTVRDGVWIGGQSGLADGVVRTATQSETWENGFGDGLKTVALNGVVTAASGAVTGGVTGAALSPFMHLRGLPDTPAQAGTPAHDVRLPPRAVDLPQNNLNLRPGFLPQVGLPSTEIDSGGILAMVKKFASPSGLREFFRAVSSTPRVKRHNTSSWITSRIDSGDYVQLSVPIRAIRSQHGVDGLALDKTLQRAARIEAWLNENPQATSMSMSTLDTLAGSTGSIQVGWHSGERFITLDGVGRIEAVREALRRYEMAHGAPHPLDSVETYAVRLTDSEYSQLYKTSMYFRDSAGAQRAVSQHDLVPYTALPRFMVGTAMNQAKSWVRAVMYHVPIGSNPPDRRLPADLLPPSGS
jgi:hypothetical protein